MGDKKKEISDYCDKVIIFPSGNKTDFEEFMGYEVEFVDLYPDSQIKGVIYENKNFYSSPYEERFSQVNQLIFDRKVVGVLCNKITFGQNSSNFNWSSKKTFYGMPVRKKENSENEN